MEVQKRIDLFKEDLKKLTIESMVRKHITFGDCYMLRQDLYFDLKAEISIHFGVHPSEIIMVGSGKLGFSIVDTKRYRPFGDSSDLDIAIVSSTLFDNIWLSVYDYKNQVGFWPREQEFKSYLFRGWIRPDFLPPSEKFDTCKNWWEFFRSLSSAGKYGPYKVAAGLYRSWHFLESYHGTCIEDCKLNLGGI